MVDQTSSPTQVDAKKEGITFKEFLKKYDGKHAELVYGEVIIQVSNNALHQDLRSFLDNLLRLFLGLKKLGKLRLAGFPMFVGDDVPTREPDIAIVLNEHLARFKATYIDGAADICIEIVSPESASRDYADKFKEYEAAGVREYWIIDPQRQIADIYALSENNVYRRNPLDSQGRIFSTLLPGFAIDPTILWFEELPEGFEYLRIMSEMTGIKLG